MQSTFKRLAAGAMLIAAAGSAFASDAVLDRGRYLVRSIVACGNCHTQQGPNGPEAGKELAGQLIGDDAMGKVFARNITPDPQTGIGNWTDEQIAAAIREGHRPDGSVLGPPMPFGLYRSISDSDLKAIIAYVRSVPAVHNVVPKSQYRIPLPPSWGPPVGHVPEVARTDKLAWGAYLAGPLGHCVECHSSPDAHGAPDRANHLGEGGMVFEGPWGRSVAANITPTGLKRYSDADLKRIITTGVRPDGSHLKPPMGVAYYAHLAPDDLDAIVAYLRSLPPR